jgi:8-oxo-dGTP pyrophosphatase MutT (NUDIX family)
MREVWKPHVVVAAVVEIDGKFLVVEEHTSDGVRFNQPAGHWEANETLTEAVVRETLEETGYHFRPTALLGIYHYATPAKVAPDQIEPGQGITYLRFAFRGEITGQVENAQLDDGIIGPQWLTYEALAACPEKHRSPLVMHGINDYLAKKSYPLELLSHLA